jgi:hypothetical protein
VAAGSGVSLEPPKERATDETRIKTEENTARGEGLRTCRSSSAAWVLFFIRVSSVFIRGSFFCGHFRFWHFPDEWGIPMLLGKQRCAG